MIKNSMCRSVFLILLFFLSCQTGPRITFERMENRIEVMYDGQQITTYLFNPDLPKPILCPVKSPSGIVMNRHFPMKMVEGESRDHPHHTSLFFTYDEVNNDGFWNNTETPPQIQHVKVCQMQEGKKGSVLSVLLHWIGERGTILNARTISHLYGKRCRLSFEGGRYSLGFS